MPANPRAAALLLPIFAEKAAPRRSGARKPQFLQEKTKSTCFLADALFWMRQQPNLPWGNPKVLSAQESLTSVFGMRTGGSSPLSSPQWLYIPRLPRIIYSYDPFPLSKRNDHIPSRPLPISLGRFTGLPNLRLKIDNCTEFSDENRSYFGFLS